MDRRPELPPEFCPDTLRRRYADLADFSDEALRTHYEQWGRNEGRVASDAAFREHFLGLIGPDQDALEIGPYFNPILHGPRVRYLDMYTAEKLRLRALWEGHDAAGCPQEIHFVGGLEACPEAEFDLVFSSHALEHQPDLVGHLEQVERILRPGGRYMMIVPDSRYCFDRTLPLSRVSEVVQAHQEKRRGHSLATLIDHYMFTDHNDPVAHWRGHHSPSVKTGEECIRAARTALQSAGGVYIDAHAWRFSPRSFRDILGTLNTTGLLNLTTLRVYDTPFGRFEFMAALQKCG